MPGLGKPEFQEDAQTHHDQNLRAGSGVVVLFVNFFYGLGLECRGVLFRRFRDGLGVTMCSGNDFVGF